VRRILVSGLALAILAVVAFVLPTLGISAEEPAKDLKKVSGKVAVTKGEGADAKVTAVTITTKKTRTHESEVIHVRVDDKGLELAKLHGKLVKASGTIEETKDGDKVVKTMKVEEFSEFVPKPRAPKEAK